MIQEPGTPFVLLAGGLTEGSGTMRPRSTDAVATLQAVGAHPDMLPKPPIARPSDSDGDAVSIQLDTMLGKIIARTILTIASTVDIRRMDESFAYASIHSHSGDVVRTHM